MSAPPNRRTKRLVALAATVFALLAAEVGFRVRAYRRNAEVLDNAFHRSVNPAPGAPADLIDLIRPSPDDRIVYELKPDLDRVDFKRHPVSTNSLGFRSKEYPAEKGENTIVVFGLGDSVMFGHGVADGQDCMAHLEEELNRRFPQKEWRVYNSGVPGYNTVMEVATLQEKGLQLEPDVVVLNLVGNDLVLPMYMRSEEDVFTLRKSFLVDYVRAYRATEEDRNQSSGLEHKTEWDTRYGNDPESIPEKYRSLRGQEAFDAALDELKALSEVRGFEVIAFNNVNLAINPKLLAKAAERGFHTFTVHQDLVDHLQEKYGKPFTEELYTSSDLVVNKNNPHPSVLHHRIAAHRLVEEMIASGMMQELLDE